MIEQREESRRTDKKEPKIQRERNDTRGRIASSLPLPRLRKFMIIEDNQPLADTYRRILEQNGHTVVINVASVEEALSRIKEAYSPITNSSDGKPEIVIADNSLPDGIGLEVSKQLLLINPKLKIILATADANVSDAVAKEAGIVRLLIKPFSMSSLIAAVTEISKGLEIEEESSFALGPIRNKTYTETNLAFAQSKLPWGASCEPNQA